MNSITRHEPAHTSLRQDDDKHLSHYFNFLLEQVLPLLNDVHAASHRVIVEWRGFRRVRR